MVQSSSLKMSMSDHINKMILDKHYSANGGGGGGSDLAARRRANFLSKGSIIFGNLKMKASHKLGAS